MTDTSDFRKRLLLATFLAAALFAAATAASAEDDCATCHAQLLQGKTMHPVASACTSCHQSVSTPHPKKGVKTFKLSQEPAELCAMCHPAVGKKKTVHFPVANGMCTTCHDAHSTAEPKLLKAPPGDLCKACHADHVDFKVVHGPVSAGGCTACHAPHDSDTKKLLVKEGPDLCVVCHVDMGEVVKKKVVHPPMSGGCTACHNPHGSAHPKLLAAEGKELCFVCHAAVGEKVKGAKVPHLAVEAAGCPACHSPHASDNERLLLKPVKETCLVCHGGVVTKAMTVFHGPNGEGKCTACHEPHGGASRKLLTGDFPAEPYVPYTETAYGLCFSCHNRDLLQYKDTSFATNFRDGEKNLHHVHVHDEEKGRSCKLCHNVHGTSAPKLIAESVPFGKWNLPLGFVKTDTGGGCTPGCHKPQFYDRESPGRKPAAAKPAG